jgi:methyltransferase (TIGR00027 family)
MDDAVASKTALRVALRRAAHQIYDSPLVFEDPLAVRILGPAYKEELKRTPIRADRPHSVALRAFLVGRSRYAEDLLQEAVARGVDQYVLLGAGLDTFAYRNPYTGLRVFEVDHPATQRWKRDLLASAEISIPPSLTYAPVDFETQSLATELSKAGLDRQRPAFFAWLGVTPYLSLAAFRTVIQFVGELAQGSGLVLDYAQPPSVLTPLEQLERASLASRVAQAGEPFQLYFTPAEIATELAAFDVIEDLGATEINHRYFQDRSDQLALRGSGGRLLSAWRR